MLVIAPGSSSTFSPRRSRRIHTRAKSRRRPPRLQAISHAFLCSSKVWISVLIFPLRYLPSGRRCPDGTDIWRLQRHFCHIFGLAMSRQEAAQQLALLVRMLKHHPSFRDAGRWLFEDYAHNRLSDSERKPLEAYSLDGTVRHIPVPDKMIAGSTALKDIQPPHNFYWQPIKPNSNLKVSMLSSALATMFGCYSTR